MSKLPPQQPQIYDYLRRYQEDPTSRVFAPLAEAYRKSGLIAEAIEIAREGLRIHPGFIGGRVALARALFDLKNYSEVVEELAPVVQDVPDNLVAQRIIAESYLMLGRIAEALGAYKMLLYFSPSDPETAKIVQELEAQAYEKGTLVLRTDSKSASSSEGMDGVEGDPESAALGEFDVKSASGAIENSPERQRERHLEQWMARIESVQRLLLKVERYRVRTALQRGAP
jgi:tetratricopeptide (TPR) repeat protein